MVRFQINIASGEYFKKKIARAALYGMMLILFLLIGFDLTRLFQIRKSETEFDARIQRVLSEKQRLESAMGQMGRGMSEDAMKAMRKEIRFVNDLLLQKSFSWTSFLSDLEDQVPTRLSVTHIQPDFKTGAVTLKGAARSLNDLTDFMNRLQKSKNFEDVFLIDQEGFEKEEGKGISFSIRFKYHGRKGMKSGSAS